MLTINNTIDGAIQDIEIKGNTVQDPDNLADIKSVGELQEDGTYKMSILSCGKNLFNTSKLIGGSFVEFKNKPMYKFTDGNKPFEFTGISYLENTAYTLSIRMFRDDDQTSKLTNIIIQYTDGSVTDVLIRSGEKKHISTDPNKTVAKIKGAFNYSANAYIDLEDLQIEEGTQATPYEPYQGNKCDILLPCQLEKVGDVSDRLYYDDVEKAWCIEKNIETIVLNGSETWLKYRNWDTINTMLFYLDYNAYKVYNKHVAKKEYTECKSNLFNYSPRTDFVNLADKEKIIMYGANTGGDINITTCSPQISILKSKLPTQDVTGFKTWLSQNPTLVKYQLETPQKIVLPLSTQIALNSFFGTTHVYMESGEVEGTIKCKIPKSIGATVQSLNNKTDILSDRIEAIEGLKDSQNMKYETDKGYLVCKETKNGVIDDMKLEGKTLVNLGYTVTNVGGTIEDNGKLTLHFNTSDSNMLSLIKPNTTYTMVFFNLVEGVNSCYLCGTKSSIKKNIALVTTPDTLHKTYVHVYGNKPNSTLEDFKHMKFIILEGDHTQNPPSYFEGLMSVGQDVDKIEVLSRKEDGNLLDIKEVKGYFGNSPSYNEGVITGGYGIEIHPNNLFLTKGTYIFSFELDRKTDSVVDYYTIAFCGYNSENILGNIVINTLNNGICTKTITIDRDINVKYIKFDCRSQRTNTTVSNICLSKTSNHTYTTHQSDKKQILFYNSNGELEPIQELHEWDSIEKHSDNKWYYHKRSGKVVLNGSENWRVDIGVNFQVDTICFTYDDKTLLDTGVLNCTSIVDKFKVDGFNVTFHTKDCESYSTGWQQHFIKIQRSKLSTQDVQGFKQWLQANNITVVYQLAQEEVYELAPLHLDSYANETLILCNSGAISPKMEFSITSHINELVKAYGERVNLLEEKVYQYMVTQNRMQLASTYSADSVTFKVDYFSLCGDEENYDEDLYNLILNNILVGKDNYNYDKMFTIILDYASWNQISWEQFDILVGLMDIQHNPPVEELPTEDEIEEDIIEEDIIENEETPVE